MSGGWESYFIPGTKVLKNRLGLDDAEELRILEERLVFLRITELDSEPVKGDFDYAHFKAIHRHLFQDVYEWAGEERTAPMGQFMIKAGHAYYPAGPEMTKAAEQLFGGLAKDNFLRGLGIDEFVAKLAELWASSMWCTVLEKAIPAHRRCSLTRWLRRQDTDLMWSG